MKRIVKLAGLVAVLVVLWLACLHNAEDPYYLHVLLAPVYVIAAIGIYAFCSLSYGVATFRTCPEEAVALKKEVEAARKDLIKRGVLSG